MPKTKISEYSTTNTDNSDIEGINIAEGCAPSGINNAIREIMVHLKEFQTGASGDAFTFAGGTLMTGTNTMSGTNVLSGSTTVALAAGAVGTPSAFASGDTNTGFWFPAADTIAASTDGSERVRISSTGNVGVNTNAPGSTLDVKGTLRLSGSSSGYVGISPAAAAGSTTYTLPSADGTNGQLLSTNGSGTLSWATAASGDVTLNGTQTLTNKTLTDPAIIGTILEDVFTITDGAAFEIDPGNGSVQLITLGASRTPKATNFAAGEAITLMVDDGTARTLTWTDATFGGSGVVWVGGSAPTLATTGYTVIELWKVSTQVYGALVGNA